MKLKERDLLLELHTILTKVPFPHDGGALKTARIDGYVGYQEDMRALVPMIQKILMGMVTIDNLIRYPDLKNELEEGWDYHEPQLVLAAIKKWLALRNSQKWQQSDRYALQRIYKEMSE